MDIYITGNQALAIVRSSRLGRGVDLRSCEEQLRAPETCSASVAKSALRLVRTVDWGNPGAASLELLISTRAHQTHDSDWHLIRHAGALKPDGYRELVFPAFELHAVGLPGDTRVFVDSPARCLERAASSLAHAGHGRADCRQESFVRTLCLMDELMGTYGRGPNRPMKSELVYGLAPALARKDVDDFLLGCRGGDGARLVARVLPFAGEGLASPLEALTHALLSLPPRYGGIGLGAFEVNASMFLGGGDGPVSHSHITPDLTSKDLGIVVECDGRAFHESDASFVEDRKRWRDYQVMGYSAVPVTFSDVCSLGAIDLLAESLISVAGDRLSVAERFRVRRAVKSESARERRLVLIKTFLPR